MSTIALVTDSTSGVGGPWAIEHNVHVLPATVAFGNEVYRDGVDLTSSAFFERLRAGGVLPKTSQPALGEFVALYRKLLEKVDSIISIHVSSGMSSTPSTAEAARGVLEREVGRGLPIHVIDSKVASAGTALVVSAAAEAIAAGQSALEIVGNLTRIVERMFTGIAIDTLEFLHKNGRIGSVAVLLGSMLQVKPILCFRRDGSLGIREKVRTTHRCRERLAELVVAEAGSQPVHLGICHAGAPEGAELVRQYVAERLDIRESIVAEFSPVVGSHSGPGAVGVGMYAD